MTATAPRWVARDPDGDTNPRPGGSGAASGVPAPSSGELLAGPVLEVLGEQGFTLSVVRVVDHDVEPGVEVDTGEGDE